MTEIKYIPSKGFFDKIVLLTVIFTLFFTSVTVSSSMLKKDENVIGFIQNDSNFNFKEIYRSSSLPDDVCDDCDDDNDDPTVNDKPIAYIFSIEPNPAKEHESVFFEGYGEDVDGEIIAYQWESDIDEILGNTSSFNINGLSPGVHIISFFVQDDENAWSDPENLSLEILENQPPEIPIIAGKLNAKAGTEYEYTFITTDPESHELYYYVEWGDNSIEEWIGLYSSSELVKLKHTWEKKGTYNMRAKAKDIYDAESDWANLQISMPKNKAMDTPFLRFLEMHPRMFSMLSQLLGL